MLHFKLFRTLHAGFGKCNVLFVFMGVSVSQKIDETLQKTNSSAAIYSRFLGSLGIIFSTTFSLANLRATRMAPLSNFEIFFESFAGGIPVPESTDLVRSSDNKRLQKLPHQSADDVLCDLFQKFYG